jgi:hypothetical protein
MTLKALGKCLISVGILTSLGDWAQADQAIVFKKSGSKVQVSIPTNGSQAPSVLMNPNSGVIATGNAANILSQAQARSESNLMEESEVAIEQIPAFDSQRSYVGAFSKIGSRLFMGSAHVLNKLGEREFKLFVERLNLKTTDTFIYQFVNTKPLDAVLVSDLTVEEIKIILSSISGRLPVSGDLFTMSHLTHMDNELVEQRSSGKVSISSDRQFVYLPTGMDSFLTWGSSGALVFNQKSQSLIGLVQCVVKLNVASSSTNGNRSYFRAISFAQLRTSSFVRSTLQQLLERQDLYGLEKCGPVSGKDGGGG